MNDEHRLVDYATTSEPPAPETLYGAPEAAVLFPPVRNVELPERQRRIVGLIARGYTTVEIARMLGISVNTVANHRRAALLRLGLHGPVGLTHYAILRGLVQPGDVPGETHE